MVVADEVVKLFGIDGKSLREVGAFQMYSTHVHEKRMRH